MASRVMHIAEVALRVKDLLRMVAFYQEAMGLEIVRASSQETEYENQKTQY